VGKDLAEAIYTPPNNTFKFAEVPLTGVKVNRGMTHDGLGKYLSQVITKAPGSTSNITGILKETKTDVVISYLPVGSEAATKWYVEQILDAGCGMVNCIPVFIARENYWQQRFAERGLPVIGDDIKSQVGATITHRVLTRLFREQGVKLERTYQLNFGGNTDFYNMLERERPGVEEDLQDQRRHLAARLQAGPGQHSRGAERLRSVAYGPQVVLHSHGRNHLWQCTAEP